MPIDGDGNKWACEACVRGHRATRCTHFDRWMVRVKKPGRPLRECPHAPGVDCTCADEKVIMIAIPSEQKPEPKGHCKCQKVRSFDAAIDNPEGFDAAVDNPKESPPRRSPRQKDQSSPSRKSPSRKSPSRKSPSRKSPSRKSEPAQQLPGPSNAGYSQFREHVATVGTSPIATPSQYLKADLSHGLAIQNAMQSQQHAWVPRLNHLVTPEARPMTPMEGIQVSHQEQLFSPTLLHNRAPKQVFLGDDANFNLGYQSLQTTNAQLQPNISPYYSFGSVLNNSNGLGPGSVSTSSLIRSSDSSQSVMDPAHRLTVDQNTNIERPGYQTPGPHHLYPTYDPGMVPNEKFNAFTSSQNCSCGPGCNCEFCSKHPYNSATISRVQALAKSVDNYASMTPLTTPQTTQPNSAFGGTPTNGPNTHSVMAQEYRPPLNGSFAPSAFAWLAMQPEIEPQETFIGEESTGQLGNRFFTMQYRVHPTDSVNTDTYTDTTGTCFCTPDCPCMGCLSHQGHS